MLGAVFTAHLYAGHVTFICAYPWIPLVLLFLDKSLRNHSWKWAIYCGGILGIQILAGYPQISLFTGMCVVFYTVAWMIRKDNWKQNYWKPILVGFTAVMISMVQIIPTLIFTFLSGRSSGVDFEFATSYSLPPENLITLISPLFLGDVVSMKYWGRWFLWEILPYAGFLPFVLVLTGFFVKDFKIRIASLLAVFGIFMAMGKYTGYFEFFYDYIPGLSMFRAPGRFVVFFALGAAMSTGLILQYIMVNKEKVLKPAVKILTGIAVFTGILLILGYESEGGNSLFWKTVMSYTYTMGERIQTDLPIYHEQFLNDTYNFAFRSLVYTLTMAIGGACLLAFFRLEIPAKNVIILLTVLICADLLWFSNRYIKESDNVPQPFNSAIETTLKKDKLTRIATKSNVPDLSRGSMAGLAHIGGYDPAQLKRYTEYINTWSGRKADEELVISEPIRPHPLMKAAGISHVMVKHGMPAYPDGQKILSNKEGDIYKLKDSMGRVFMSHNVEVIPDLEKRLTRLGSKEFDPRKAMVVESDIKLEPVAGKERAGVAEYSSDSIKIMAEASSRCLLVLNDAHYPLWEATVDGKPAEIHPVNHLFRGVVIEKGKHEVVFTYNKKPFLLGLIISLLAVWVILGISTNLWKRSLK